MSHAWEITSFPSRLITLRHYTACANTHPSSPRLPRPHLIDNVDAVVQLLPLEDWVQVIQPVLEVFLPVAEWNNDGHLVRRDAVLGGVATTHLHLRVLFRQKHQVHRRLKLDQQGAN